MKKVHQYLKLNLLLAIILSFFVILAFLIYQNTYKQTEIDTRRYILNELQTNVERSVSLGKNYSKNYAFNLAINQSLGSNVNNLGIRQIVFINSNGDILYKHEGRRYHNYPKLLQLIYPNNQLQEVVEDGSLLWVNTGLRKYKLNSEDSDITEDFGAFWVAYRASAFNPPIQGFIDNFGLYILASYILGSFLLIFALKSKKENEIQEENIKVFHFSKPKVFLAIILAQTLLSFFILSNFINLFKENASYIIEQSLEVEQKKIVRLLDMGLPIYEYSRASEFYINELANNDNISKFEILDSDSSLILSVNLFKDSTNSNFNSFSKELITSDGVNHGRLIMTLGNSAVFNKFISALADILTIFVVSLLAATEYIFFISLPKAQANQLKSEDAQKQLIPIWYMRAVIAIFNFATSLTISFLPLTMLKFTTSYGFFGISPVVASSLPGTFEFAATLLSFIFVQKINNKHGWQSAFLIGTILYALGSIASAFAFTPLTLVLARMICGFAYGFTWLATYFFVFSNVPIFKNRALAFSLTSAGIYSGYLSGTITGGVLSAQLSASSVFMLAAITSLCSMGVIIFSMAPYQYKKNIEKVQQVITNTVENVKSKVNYFDYIKNINIFACFILVLIPLAILQIGLLNFGVPITLSELNFSTASISRAIISYGLVQIYIAPILMKRLSNYQNKRLLLFLGVILVFISLLISAINVYTLFCSIFLFGIAAAIIWPTLSSFLLNQPISEKLGILKAVTIQRFADKMGQALGPVLYGIMFSIFNYSKTIIILSTIFLLLGILFYTITKPNTETN